MCGTRCDPIGGRPSAIQRALHRLSLETSDPVVRRPHRGPTPTPMVTYLSGVPFLGRWVPTFLTFRGTYLSPSPHFGQLGGPKERTASHTANSANTEVDTSRADKMTALHQTNMAVERGANLRVGGWGLPGRGGGSRGEGRSPSPRGMILVCVGWSAC